MAHYCPLLKEAILRAQYKRHFLFFLLPRLFIKKCLVIR